MQGKTFTAVIDTISTDVGPTVSRTYSISSIPLRNNAIALNFKMDYFQKDESNEPCTSKPTKEPLVNNLFKDFEEEEREVSTHRPISISVGNEKDCRSINVNSIKLPFGIELTAGTSSKNNINENDNNKRKTVLPSDVLLASASYIKTYFGFSQDKEIENDESVKEKMKSLWHNMKYGWSANIKTNFSRETPIYLLGKVYHKTLKEDRAYQGTKFYNSNIEGFIKDFTSLSWFTYRRKFPQLPDSTLSSDCGWGCMVRSGQMVMATALTRHFLPPGWRYNSKEDDPQTSIHKQIMKWFCDFPSKKIPFSIHKLVSLGHKMNKKAGSWYGPSCVAHIFKEAVADASNEIAALEKLVVYVAQDGAIYTQDVIDLCTANRCICLKRTALSSRCSNTSVDPCTDASLDQCSSLNYDIESYSVIDKLEQQKGEYPIDLFVDSNRELAKEDVMTSGYAKEETKASCGSTEADMNGSGDATEEDQITAKNDICALCQGWKSCLILIPVRLGGARINPIYHQCIYSLFLHDLCIGIIGGKPKHSLYFVGFQEDNLIHLDPHLSQDSLLVDDPIYPLGSYHCSSPKKISISKMDPSATIGFYCHTKGQFMRLIRESPMFAVAREKTSMESPIFEFIDGKSSDLNGWLSRTLNEESARISISETDSCGEESEILCFD